MSLSIQSFSADQFEQVTSLKPMRSTLIKLVRLEKLVYLILQTTQVNSKEGSNMRIREMRSCRIEVIAISKLENQKRVNQISL